MVPLLSLPNELIQHIAQLLEYADEVSALARTCRLLHSLVNPFLFPHYAKHRQIDAMNHAMDTGDHVLMAKLLKAGVQLSDYEHATHHSTYCTAAKTGHLGIVRLLLEADRDYLHEDSAYDRIPLVCALSNGHLDVARFMISQGADPDFTTATDQRTALSILAGHGPMESVRFLVEETASNLDARDPTGWTPLFHAAAFGRLDVLRFLVQAGADTGVRDGIGKTALFHAAYHEKEGAVAFLLENGVGSQGFLNQLDAIALARLASKGKGRVAGLLLERIDLSERLTTVADRKKLSAWLFFSAACGCEKSVRLLLENGCDPMAKVRPEDPPGQGQRGEFAKYETPIRQAAANGHASVIWLLLDSIRARDSSKVNTSIAEVMYAAAENNQFTLLEAILGHELTENLDPTSLDSYKSQALWLAAPYKEATTVLLDHGANPEWNGDGGFYVLETALEKGNHGSVERLLAVSKVKPLQNPPELPHTANHLSLLETAVLHSNLEIVKILLEATDKADFHPGHALSLQALLRAIHTDNVEIVQYFLDNGFDVNCKVPGGQTGAPLLVFTPLRFGSPSNAVLKLLLDRGAEVDMTNSSQQTALWFSVTRDNHVAVQTLLDYGADPLHQDKDGKTPLIGSVSARNSASLKAILKAMEDRGLRCDLTDAINKAQKVRKSGQQENRLLKYLTQHLCRTMYPC